LPAVTAALVTTMLAERLVNAAGLPAQLAFSAPAALVRPATVTVHEAVPAVMAMPVKPFSSPVPLLYAAVAGPEQPAEYATAGAAGRRRLEGMVSVSAMPECAGLVPELVSVKTTVVVPASL